VILGWAFAGESFTGRMLIGAGVIVGSVVLITSQSSEPVAEGEAGLAEEKADLVESSMENCPT
jgi:hypothetical protein